MKELPQEITPNPVVGAIVECRIKSDIERHKLLPLVISKFMQDFPIYEEGKFPFEFKNNNEELKYFPDFTLKNELYSIGFSTNSITLEINNEYPLWSKYFEFVSESIEKIIELNFIAEIERVGLRFISFFEEDGADMKDKISNLPSLQLNEYTEEVRSYKTYLTKDNIRLYLQIFKEKTIYRNDDQESTGMVIDIDTDVKDNLILDKNSICNIINDLHNSEKELFFSILNSEFLSTKNPKYN